MSYSENRTSFSQVLIESPDDRSFYLDNPNFQIQKFQTPGTVTITDSDIAVSPEDGNGFIFQRRYNLPDYVSYAAFGFDVITSSADWDVDFDQVASVPTNGFFGIIDPYGMSGFSVRNNLNTLSFEEFSISNLEYVVQVPEVSTAAFVMIYSLFSIVVRRR